MNTFQVRYYNRVLHEMEEARRSGNKILVTAPVPLVLLIAGLLLLILKYLSSNLPMSIV
jgi:hypothetical protein